MKDTMENNNIQWATVVKMIVLLCILQWMWPNVVHEPLHMVALKMQGADGYVDFDWSFPAHPTTTRVTQLSGPIGAMVFYLLPSIISIIILTGLFVTRHHHKLVNVWSHFVFPAYLGFDLIINVRGFANPISDFRVLQLVHPIIPWMIIVGIACMTMWIIMSARCTVQESCVREVFG